MDILTALNQQPKKEPEPTSTTGDSYIRDGVFTAAMVRAGVDEEIIADCLLEPVERRGELLEYFEGLANG